MSGEVDKLLLESSPGCRLMYSLSEFIQQSFNPRDFKQASFPAFLSVCLTARSVTHCSARSPNSPTCCKPAAVWPAWTDLCPPVRVFLAPQLTACPPGLQHRATAPPQSPLTWVSCYFISVWVSFASISTFDILGFLKDLCNRWFDFICFQHMANIKVRFKNKFSLAVLSKDVHL